VPDDGSNKKRQLVCCLRSVAKGGIEPPSTAADRSFAADKSFAADVVRRKGYVPDDGSNKKRQLICCLRSVAKGGIEPPSAAADRSFAADYVPTMA
jgi:hypothetical protein